ncbi:MAG: hypothetical protein ACYSWP_23945 [Planctomycetota bacterium]|jgi:hypothetical protein
MMINFWDCDFGDYDETATEDGDIRHYMCNHPDGDGICELDNKYGGGEADCKLLNKTLLNGE